VPRYRSVVWTDACPKSSCICSSSPPAARHIFAQLLLKIVRCDSGYTGRAGVRLKELPHYLLGHSLPLGLVRSVHRSQHVALDQPSRQSPRIYRAFHPVRHRNRTHAAELPDKVHNAPPAMSLLKVLERKRGHFGPPQASMARSRSPFLVDTSGAFNSVCA
jgi:hypothetical protein